MATRKGKAADSMVEVQGLTATEAVQATRHRAKRKNIPPAGLEAQGRVEEAPKARYEYNPQLPPVLRFADDPAAADRLPQLLATARERALSADEAAILAAALRRHEPWLEWAFFPDRKKWDKLARALGDKGVVDEGRFDALSGFESLPFARPPRLPQQAPWRVAVKVIDPRGNEGLRVITMASVP